MSLLGLIKTYIIALEGSGYEPLVNGVLFFGLVAAVLSAAIRLIFGRQTVSAAKNAMALIKKIQGGLDKSVQYAPGAEAVRKKAYPYFQLAYSVYFTFVGLLYGLGVGFITAWLLSKLPWYHTLTGFSFSTVCLIFARFNIAEATWAWHEIRTGEGRPKQAAKQRKKKETAKTEAVSH